MVDRLPVRLRSHRRKKRLNGRQLVRAMRAIVAAAAGRPLKNPVTNFESLVVAY